MIFFGSLCKTKKTVDTSQEISIYLYLRNKLLHSHNKLIKELCLKSKYLLVGTKNLFLVFLQFLSDITLCLSKSLLTNPAFWHFVLISVAHFKVVSKDIVISHLKRRNTCFLSFFLLNLQQIILSVTTDRTQLIKFGTIAVSNNIALIDKLWRIVLNFFLYSVLQTFTKIQLFAYPLQSIVI